MERDTVVVLGSDSDSPGDWIRAGQAFALLVLTLTAEGLVSQPLGPVMDLPGTRKSLGRELGRLGYPQMVLRAGYAVPGRPTGRRGIGEILEPMPTTPPHRGPRTPDPVHQGT